jgi:hypothetical protein
MKPKIIEVKDPVFENARPPEQIIYSYQPKIQVPKQKKSIFESFKSFLKL